uniref:Glycosyltransferase family 1 protein n=1 Tax=Ignisphaera aggregans TaxID=334771 RepID=A0A7J2U1Z6_9CREN
MKIVHVHVTYYPVVSGLGIVTQKLAEGMAKLGHEVHVITSTRGAEDRPRYEVLNGVHVHRVRSLKPPYENPTYPLEYPVDVIKHADIIHGHHQSLFATKIVEKAKDLDIPLVMHIMSVDTLNDYPNPIIRLLGPLYEKWLLKKALRVADVKLVKSYRDMEILRSKYGIEAIYVPDGIDKELITLPSMAKEFREKYGIEEPFVIYIGRLHKLKGVHILIKAMSIVSKEIKDLKAVIVGPGNQKPYRRLVEKLGIKDRVLFFGYLDEKTKIAALDASTALVLPSICNYAEAFSLVTSEAWARNKPVIASAVGEMPYRIKHMVNGLLVPPRNSKALAEAIILIASDKNLAMKLGSEGKKNLVTWNEVITKLLQIYTKAKMQVE